MRCRRRVRARSAAERMCDDFWRGALRSFMDHSNGAARFSASAHATPAAQADADLKAALDDGRAGVCYRRAGAIPNVHAIDSAASSASLSGAPTTTIRTAISSDTCRTHRTVTPRSERALVRTIFGLNSHPFKVIVLDCDNTLWKGVCGEDGPSRRRRDAASPRPAGLHAPPDECRHAAVPVQQEQREGCPRCLRHAERHGPAARAHRVLAGQLEQQSGQYQVARRRSSISDWTASFWSTTTPWKCADVRIELSRTSWRCSCRRTPSHSRRSSDHVWAFDRRATTDEDRSRTRLYRENAERHRLRERSLSLQDFIRGLDLRVEISEAPTIRSPRISQLTLRTNQFNLTTIRRTEDEIRRFMQRDDAACLVVRVVDRFGDYGLVGVVMYEVAGDRCTVDTFLLSCRVLGRGVEHSVLSQLARRAQQEGRQWIELACQPTSRNTPARDFLDSYRQRARRRAEDLWLFRVDESRGPRVRP